MATETVRHIKSLFRDAAVCGKIADPASLVREDRSDGYSGALCPECVDIVREARRL